MKKKHDDLHVELPPILSLMPIHKSMIQNPLINSTMGNCIDILMRLPKEEIRVLMFDGRESSMPGQLLKKSPVALRMALSWYTMLSLIHHCHPTSG